MTIDLRILGGRAADLRTSLMTETPGQRLAYLTDFQLDEAAEERLATVLAGCDLVVCEAQYRHADLPLAQRNRHMTATLAAQLAKRAGVRQLVLFHLSLRYAAEEHDAILAEAQAVFPATSFPAEWGRGGSAASA